MSTKWPLITHGNYKQAFDLARSACLQAGPGDVVLITGPTGVGKTTMVNPLKEILVGCNETWPRGEIHAVSIDCDKVPSSSVTRSIAIRINRAFGNPYVQLKIPGEPVDSFRGRVSLNEADLRETSRILAAINNTAFLFMDALEVLVPKHRVSGTARFDAIKALGSPHERSDIPAHQLRLVLFGHYSLLNYWTENAQLSRRVFEVPLFPYSCAPNDILHWEYLLNEISPLYPLQDGTTLRAWNDLLFDMSAGCPGILHKLLESALVHASQCGDRKLTLKHLAKAAFPKVKMDQIRTDLSNFRAYFDSSLNTELFDAVEKRHNELSTVDRGGAIQRPGRKANARDQVGNL